MVCWLALAVPDAMRGEPRVELFSGVMSGAVAGAKRGSGGFGYDPVFQLPSGMTAAELPDAEKDRLSHRGQAVAAAAPRLRALLEEG
jgi:XTP/dITP diphosphohydrolase